MNKHDILTSANRTQQVVNWCFRNTPKQSIVNIKKIVIERGAREGLQEFNNTVFFNLERGNGIGDNPEQLGYVLQYAIDYHTKQRVVTALFKKMIKKRVSKKAIKKRKEKKRIYI